MKLATHRLLHLGYKRFHFAPPHIFTAWLLNNHESNTMFTFFFTKKHKTLHSLVLWIKILFYPPPLHKHVPSLFWYYHWHARYRQVLLLLSNTVGNAKMNDPATNECYNEQFLSIKSGCYNERGGILPADVTRACAWRVGPSYFD